MLEDGIKGWNPARLWHRACRGPLMDKVLDDGRDRNSSLSSHPTEFRSSVAEARTFSIAEAIWFMPSGVSRKTFWLSQRVSPAQRRSVTGQGAAW